jgi:hypothetical protein
MLCGGSVNPCLRSETWGIRVFVVSWGEQATAKATAGPSTCGGKSAAFAQDDNFSGGVKENRHRQELAGAHVLEARRRHLAQWWLAMMVSRCECGRRGRS